MNSIMFSKIFLTFVWTPKLKLSVLWYGKRHLSGWSNVEQWKVKPVALAIVGLRKSEGIRQAVS